MFLLLSNNDESGPRLYLLIDYYCLDWEDLQIVDLTQSTVFNSLYISLYSFLQFLIILSI